MTLSEPALFRLLTFHLQNLMSLLHCLDRTKGSVHARANCELYVTWQFFYGENLSTPRPNPKLEDHPLPAVGDCSFNIFAATLHIAGRSSIRNLRTRHAVVTGTHYTEYLVSTDHRVIRYVVFSIPILLRPS